MDPNSNVNSSPMLQVMVCAHDYSKPIDIMTLGLAILLQPLRTGVVMGYFHVEMYCIIIPHYQISKFHTNCQ